ncbi:MAG: type II toxin-antitoxin system HicB family antitoxin [Pseudonocardiaceae bacterium]
MNLQEVRGQAKPYQVRQLLRLVERYDLSGGGPVNDYHINVFYSEPDAGYIADIPDLEACAAFGETSE